MNDKARELLERALIDWDSYEEPYFERLHFAFEEIRAYLAELKPTQDEEPTKAEVAVYLFAGWLTCQPGIMEVGACCDASPMAQAIDQYFQEHPERMFETKLHPAPRPDFVRLSEEEMKACEPQLGIVKTPDGAKVDGLWIYDFARAIEDALEEKNRDR